MFIIRCRVKLEIAFGTNERSYYQRGEEALRRHQVKLSRYIRTLEERSVDSKSRIYRLPVDIWNRNH